MKKNNIKTMIALLAVLVLMGCQNDSNDSTSGPVTTPESTNEQGIAAHRPDVYVNGFPVITIDVDFNLPINWDEPSAYDLGFFRENWLGATLSISNTSEQFMVEDMEIRARGRGNSTWWSFGPKRPVRFRFTDENRAIFDSPHVGRDWVTFANAADGTVGLRNFVAYYLADLMGNFNFVPQTWFVHLYLDGEYRGVYMVLDEREAGPGRGDLYLHEDPTVSEFMIEFDVRTAWEADGPVNSHWVDVRGPWDIRYPSTSAWMDEENNPHALYVDDFLTRLDDAILTGDEETIHAMLDMDSFVDLYLLQEFTKNQDARWSSLFFQIRGQGADRRLYSGPVWDFDLTAGTTYYTASPEGSRAVLSYYGHERFDWFYHFYQMPWFRELAYARWQEIRDVQVRQTIERASYMAETFADDFQRDFERWPNRTDHLRYNWNSSQQTRTLLTHIEQVEFLLDWYEQRILWLDGWLSQ